MEQNNQIEGYLFYESEGEDTLKVNLSVEMKRSQYDEYNMKRTHQKKLIIALDCGESMHELKKLSALKDAIVEYTEQIIENYTNEVIIDLIVLLFDSSNCFFVPYLSQDQFNDSLSMFGKYNKGIPNFNLVFDEIIKILDNNFPPRDAFLLFITDKTCKDVDLTQAINQFQQKMCKVPTQTKFLALGCGQEDESLLDQICDIGLVKGAKTTINFNEHPDQDIIQIVLSSFVDEETKPLLNILINFFDQYQIVAPLEDKNQELLFFISHEILIKSSIVFNEIVKNHSQPTIQGFKINFKLEKAEVQQVNDNGFAKPLPNGSEYYTPEKEAEFQQFFKEANSISYDEKVSDLFNQIWKLEDKINNTRYEENTGSNKRSAQVRKDVLKEMNKIRNIVHNSLIQKQEFLDPNQRQEIKVILDNANEKHVKKVKDLKKVHPECNLNEMAEMIQRRLLENGLPQFMLIALKDAIPVLQLIQILAEHLFQAQGKKLEVSHGICRTRDKNYQMQTYSVYGLKPQSADINSQIIEKPIKYQKITQENYEEVYQLDDHSTQDEFELFCTELYRLEFFQEQKGDQWMFDSIKQRKFQADLERSLKMRVQSMRFISKTQVCSDKLLRNLKRFLTLKKDKKITFMSERFRYLENGKNQIVKAFTISFNQ